MTLNEIRNEEPLEAIALPDADLLGVLAPALVDTLSCEGWDVRAEVVRRLIERLTDAEATVTRMRKLPATLGTVYGPAILEKDLYRALVSTR